MTEIRDRAEPRYNYPRRGNAPRSDAEFESPQGMASDEHLERDREFPTASSPAPVYEVDSSVDRAQGVRDLVSGGVLIGLGMLYGGSVFTGDPTVIDWIFDGLGAFWVAKGLYHLFR